MFKVAIAWPKIFVSKSTEENRPKLAKDGLVEVNVIVWNGIASPTPFVKSTDTVTYSDPPIRLLLLNPRSLSRFKQGIGICKCPTHSTI